MFPSQCHGEPCCSFSNIHAQCLHCIFMYSYCAGCITPLWNAVMPLPSARIIEQSRLAQREIKRRLSCKSAWRSTIQSPSRTPHFYSGYKYDNDYHLSPIFPRIELLIRRISALGTRIASKRWQIAKRSVASKCTSWHSACQSIKTHDATRMPIYLGILMLNHMCRYSLPTYLCVLVPHSISAEIDAANVCLTETRRFKLKQLLDDEHNEYIAELSQRGLAIYQ